MGFAFTLTRNPSQMLTAYRWNNWNSKLHPTATNALETAELFISLGLKDLGYEYINMDDGWSKKSRDSSGNLAANDDYFPDGIAAVASQIHGLGLKFGLYGDSGTKTCLGYPGSRKHEKQDAALLASWKVDYWKYDNCHLKIWEWDWLPFTNSSRRYGDMRDALADQHQTHKILYSLCQWGKNNVWTWGANFGNSWRISRDLKNSWRFVKMLTPHFDLTYYPLD